MTDIESNSIAASAVLPPEPTTGQGFLKPIQETTPLERLAGLVAGAAVVTALAAMIIEQSAVVIVGGILSAIVGPYAYWQQTRLTDIKALQDTQKAVKSEVDKLQAENAKLRTNVKSMTDSVEHLEDVQQALSLISSTQGKSIDVFTKQVDDNRRILKQMQSNLKANVLQNLLSVILRGDTDGDFSISASEVDDLVRRLKNISGVTLREDKFRAAITGKTVQCVMDVVGNLLKDDVPEADRIFIIKS